MKAASNMFTVKKSFEYGWRVTITSSAMGWIQCWNVVTALDEVVYGGLFKGDNQHSCTPRLPTRRAANAYILGRTGESFPSSLSRFHDAERAFSEGVHDREAMDRKALRASTMVGF